MNASALCPVCVVDIVREVWKKHERRNTTNRQFRLFIINVSAQTYKHQLGIIQSDQPTTNTHSHTIYTPTPGKCMKLKTHHKCLFLSSSCASSSSSLSSFGFCFVQFSTDVYSLEVFTLHVCASSSQRKTKKHEREIERDRYCAHTGRFYVLCASLCGPVHSTDTMRWRWESGFLNFYEPNLRLDGWISC